MVMQIGASALLFIEFIIEFVAEADTLPVTYPNLTTGQPVSNNTRGRWSENLIRQTGASSWRGLQVSMNKKVKKVKNVFPLPRSSPLKNVDGGNSQLPQPATSNASSGPPRVFSNDPRLKDEPSVKNKAASYPNLSNKPPRQVRIG